LTKRNLTPEEKLYHERRTALLQQVTAQEVAEAPFLFATRIQVTQVLSRLRLFEMVRDTPGSVIECGVYKGNSLMLLVHLSLLLEPYAINRRFYGFDTFGGFRSIDREHDPSDINESMFADTNLEMLRQCLQLTDLVRPVNQIPKVELIQGDIVQTVPEFVRSHKDLCISMLILDTDLYEPTRVALTSFLPHMHKGALVVLDEVCYAKFAGETIALKDVLSLRDVELRKLPFDTSVGYFRI
jgi:hypothetical protein